jgi:hypothetical protein
MFDGSHSHSGGSSGGHSHGTGPGRSAGALVLIPVVAFGVVVIVWILGSAIANTVRNHNDRSLNQQDILIRSAKVVVKCRAVEAAGRVPHAGPACSPSTRSGALIIELKGIPAGINIGRAQLRGQYYGQCTDLQRAHDISGNTTNSFFTKKTITNVAVGSILNIRKIALPGNACAVSPGSGSHYIEIALIREGTPGQIYVIRRIIERIKPSWYRLDGSLYAP